MYCALCQIDNVYHDGENIVCPYDTLEEAIEVVEEWLSDLTPEQRSLAKASIAEETDEDGCCVVRDAWEWPPKR